MAMATSQTFKSALSNIPALTKALVTTLVVLSCSSYIYTYRAQASAENPDDIAFSGCPFIGILPGLAMYNPWTFLTAAFYEDNVFSLFGSVLVLLLCGKYLERAWGSRELLKYVVISATLSNVVTWIGIVATFYVSGDSKFLYEIQINGMAGVFSAFLVAFKHLIPEHKISLLGNAVSIRIKNLIGVATAVSIVCLILFQALVFYNLVNIGWVIGWIYIRFFKYQDAFALVTFFPEFLHPVIGFVSNIVYGFFVRLGVCKPAPRNYAYDLESQVGGIRSSPSPLPGSARAEAERRRTLALKALDMRLSTKSSAAGPSANPSTPGDLTTMAASSRSADSTIIFEAEEMATIAAPSVSSEEKIPAPLESDDAVKRD
ncbi:eukaryotic integral membrane protein-domain-containing protein [Dichotomocladium elegans]|nr:eukaryotic integral membrane protein-domain-containing protein [Dichotomocladium elegans]